MNLADVGRLQLPNRKVDLKIVSELELLEAKVYPLPGGMVSRPAGWVDPRMNVNDPLSTDKICLLEHVAAVRHRPTGKIYVAFRETADALFARQLDLEKYPKWLMNTQEKQAERQIFIHVAYQNPKVAARGVGPNEQWVDKWLKDIKDDARMFESIFYFLKSRNALPLDMVVKR